MKHATIINATSGKTKHKTDWGLRCGGIDDIIEINIKKRTKLNCSITKIPIKLNYFLNRNIGNKYAQEFYQSTKKTTQLSKSIVKFYTLETRMRINHFLLLLNSISRSAFYYCGLLFSVVVLSAFLRPLTIKLVRKFLVPSNRNISDWL